MAQTLAVVLEMELMVVLALLLLDTLPYTQSQQVQV
jgi:hypothetical protein